MSVRVVQFNSFGGPENLRPAVAERGTVGAGQVRIRVHGVGVNFAEAVQTSGAFQFPVEPPAVPGFELAGTVSEVGADVAHLSAGQRVIALVCWGAYADEVVVDASTVAAIPDNLPFDVAAAFPVAFTTAFLCLHHRARVQPGETVIISGANGNVGYAAVQVARRLGAGRVIAITRKGGELIPHADAVLAADETLAQDLAGVLGTGKADVVLDLVGGDVFPTLLDAVAWEGRLVTAGYSSGGIPDVSLVDILIRNVALLGEDVAGYTVREPHTVGEALRTLVQWYAQGALRPRPPVATHQLARAAEALQSVIDGTSGGKLVLTTD